jgi:murein L,D-transpeptidase YafK
VQAYPVCVYSGRPGPKLKEGDGQTPEGFYTVTPAQFNPNSSYRLSFNVGYPNAFDRANRYTGGSVMVHGDCARFVQNCSFFFFFFRFVNSVSDVLR